MLEMLDVLDPYIRPCGSGKQSTYLSSSLHGPSSVEKTIPSCPVVRSSVAAMSSMDTLLLIIIAGKCCCIISLQIIRHKMSAIGKVLSSYFDIACLLNWICYDLTTTKPSIIIYKFL